MKTSHDPVALANDAPPIDMVSLMDAASDNFEKAEHFVGLFFQHTAERLADLTGAIERRSSKDVYGIAHQCLGSSRTLGMDAIVPAFRELERIGNAGTFDGADAQLLNAKSAFHNIKVFWEEHVLQPV